MVLFAVSLLAFVPVATASTHAKRAQEVQRDFYQCVQPGTMLPPLDEVKACMVQKGDSNKEIAGVIRSLPDQGLFAPYTGHVNRGG